MVDHCPKCNSTLQADAPLGVCPACLMAEGALLAATNRYGAGAFLPPKLDSVASLFPEFEIESFLGRGGMGAVYKARKKGREEPIAVKLLPPEIAADPEFLERFFVEIETLERLDHPNIVKVYDYGERESYAYFVMEFVDGPDLAERLIEEPRMGVVEIVEIIRQLCEALEYSHAEGVIHRDIKPANILINGDGQVKVVDFGLAKLRLPGDTEKGLTLTRAVMGSFHYMAPEISEGASQADHRGDVYAVGVIAYEMLTGKLPVGHFELPSRHVPGLSSEVDQVVARSLKTDPDRRYQEAGEMSDALMKAVSRNCRPLKISLSLLAVSACALAVWLLLKSPVKPLPQPISGIALIEQLAPDNQPSSVKLTLSPSTSPGVMPDLQSTNRGDYWLRFSDPQAVKRGTLVTTLAENGHFNLFKGGRLGSSFGVSSFCIGGYDPTFVIDVHRLGKGTVESNLNAAFAWFSFEEFLAAHVMTVGEGKTLQSLYGSEGIQMGEQIVPLPHQFGVTRIDLTKLNASSWDGILLANSAVNDDKFALVEPKADGSFLLYIADQNAEGNRYITKNISFVYLSLADAGRGKIVALGRVRSDGEAEVSAGEFQLICGNPGQWYLEIEGHGVDSGTLLLTPLSTPEGNNRDNVLSYEWDSEAGHFVIESRDLISQKCQGGATPEELMFNFVFLRR